MDRAGLARALRASLEADATGQPSRIPAGVVGGAPRASPGGSQPAEPAPVVIAERNPRTFMERLAAAAAGSGPVFLADADWGENQCGQCAEILRRAPVAEENAPAPPDRGWLMIPSGGTGGRLKFARHDERTLDAAVEGFRRHFSFTRVDAVGVLPLHHVSGLMAWMRCALTGGVFLPWAWKDLEAGNRPAPPGLGGCLSLVPTQLQRLMASPGAIEWLRSFRIVFVGGAPLWPDLADRAARLGLPLSLGYGMTETAAMIAGLRPEEFLAGARGCGSPLPHARIDLVEEGGRPGGAEGRLARISGESIFLGYYPEWRAERSFTTEDLAEFDAAGGLRILGRRDAAIITGGKKVEPVRVEAALRATGQFDDVAVVGAPDAEWGQAVVACHPPAEPGPDLARVAGELAGLGLAGFERPKRYVAVSPWPRNAQGKVDRSELLRRVSEAARSISPPPKAHNAPDAAQGPARQTGRNKCGPEAGGRGRQ